MSEDFGPLQRMPDCPDPLGTCILFVLAVVAMVSLLVAL